MNENVFFFGIIVQGKWIGSSTWNTIVDPLNGEPFIKIAEVDETGTQVCVRVTNILLICSAFISTELLG
jgi:hypothetical protein